MTTEILCLNGRYRYAVELGECAHDLDRAESRLKRKQIVLHLQQVVAARQHGADFPRAPGLEGRGEREGNTAADGGALLAVHHHGQRLHELVVAFLDLLLRCCELSLREKHATNASHGSHRVREGLQPLQRVDLLAAGWRLAERIHVCD